MVAIAVGGTVLTATNAPLARAQLLAAPAAPSDVTASAGDLAVHLSWTPGDDNGAPIEGYEITMVGSGRTQHVRGAVHAFTVDGLTPGSSVSFTVAATNSVGTGSASAATAPTTPTAPGGAYRALPPARILDTRDGTGAPKATVPGGQSIVLQVTGRGGVPDSGVEAVVLNVTAVNATLPTHLTIWPTGASRPLASNVNVNGGAAVPNLVEVKLGAGGRVSIFNNSGQVDVIADVSGYVADASSSNSNTGLFHALAPARILDTRDGTGAPLARVGAGQSIEVQVAGAGGVPASGASAVVVNLTAVNPTADTHITAYPTGTTPPLASNVNLGAGQVRPNRVTVKLGTGGRVSLRNNSGSVDLIADVSGWYDDGSATDHEGSWFTGVTPARILDTRDGTGAPKGKLVAGTSLSVHVAGTGGIPPVQSPIPPTAAVLNVTVTQSTAVSHLTVWPAGSPKPNASDLNFGPGDTRPNLTVVKLGPEGKIDLATNSGSTDVIIDVLGWYAGDVLTASNQRALDSTALAALGSVVPDDHITFTTAVPQLAQIHVGDVLTAGRTPTTPDGLLVVVLSVDGLNLRVRRASLDEAVVQGRIRIEGSNVPGTPGAPAATSPQGFGINHTLPFNADVGSVGHLQGAFSLGVNADLTAEIHPHFGLVPFTIVGDASATVDETFDATLTANASGSIDEDIPIASVESPPEPFWIGGIGGIVQGVADFGLNVSGEGSVGLTAGVHQGEHHGVNVHFENTNITSTKTDASDPFTFTGPTATGTLEAKAALTSKFGLRFDGAATFSAGADPGLKLKADLCNVDLYMTLAVHAELEASVFGLDDQTIFEKTYDFPDQLLKHVTLHGCDAWTGTLTYDIDETKVYPDGRGGSTQRSTTISVQYTLDGTAPYLDDDASDSDISWTQPWNWTETWHTHTIDLTDGCVGDEQFTGSGRYTPDHQFPVIHFFKWNGQWILDFGVGGNVGAVSGVLTNGCPGHPPTNQTITAAQVPGIGFGMSGPPVDINTDKLDGTTTYPCGGVGSYCGENDDATVTVTYHLQRVTT